MGHAAAYSPLAKHRFEERSTKSVGPVYRYRNYWKPIVVVSDPVLQHEVNSSCFLHLFLYSWRPRAACARPDSYNPLHRCPDIAQVSLGSVMFGNTAN